MVNFDGNVFDSSGGAGFAIQDPNLRFVAAGESHLFGISIQGLELQIAWMGILYARLTLGADLVVSGIQPRS